ncbi:hypothetical protein Tco_1300614 [Tanacetum coccineum]
MFKRNRMLKSPFPEFVRDDECIGLGQDHGTKGFSSDTDQVVNVDGNSTGVLPEVIGKPIVVNAVMKETPSSYVNKLIPTSSTKANLWKLEANVPNGTDYDVWLPLASVHEVDYPVNLGSDSKVERLKQLKMKWKVFWHQNRRGVGYGPKSLLEQWREINVDDDYNPYDDDMYEGKKIPDSIQTICDNLDIKVRGQKKK